MNLRWLAIFRLTRVCLHLVLGLGIVLCVYPLLQHATRLWLKQVWSYWLVRMLGVRLMMQGTPHGGLHVANHVSWLDVFVINAAQPCAFVAKQEVRDWPVIGWLAARTDTLFIDRNSRRAAHALVQRLRVKLADGNNLAIFPEGTTSDGRAVLPFRAALLEAAALADVMVQPVALRYATPKLLYADASVYCGDTGLLESLWRIACCADLQVHADFLPPRHAAGCTRQAFADALRGEIEQCLRLSPQADESDGLGGLLNSEEPAIQAASGS